MNTFSEERDIGSRVRPGQRLMVLPWVGLLICILLNPSRTNAEDWPTYRHDNQRTGVSSEQLELPLASRHLWVTRPGDEPLPSLLGPSAAKDYWHSLPNLIAKVTHDRAPHVAVVGDRVYLGSYVHDKVFCLDANTGATLWVYYTDGPVRMAPAVAEGKVYFGSDDGFVYCLDARNASEIWRLPAYGQDDMVLGDGRMISRWPVRTGVLVEGPRAYFASGLFPNAGVALRCVDSANGADVSVGCWREEIDFPPQGYLLSGSQTLYVPRSRSSPAAFQITTGRFIGNFGGQGGTFALIADNAFFYGPNLQGTVDQYARQPGERIASFAGLQMVVSGQVSYLVGERATVAVDRGQKKNLWQLDQSFPFCLIQAGDHLFAGGHNVVAALDRTSGEVVWTAPVEGRAYGIAVANGRLFVSTDRGRLHCFISSRAQDVEYASESWNLF